MLEGKIKERNDLQVELRNEITDLKDLNNQLKTSIVTRTEQVEDALNVKKKLQSQIVSSPARFKKNIADAEWTLKKRRTIRSRQKRKCMNTTNGRKSRRKVSKWFKVPSVP